MSICIACFGTVERFSEGERVTIISVSVALRLGQGVAAGMINTAAYSFATQAYPDRVDKIISLMEGVVGIGITFSPVMGSFIYQAVGFSATFYIFGVSMSPVSLAVCLCLDDPKKIRERYETN